ncbi:MAG: glycosyltransferase family 2 protein [Pseudomonadota bacterium]
MTGAVDPREVLVVVPTLNEEAHIETCLRSLMDDDPRMAAVSVVVSDGGSADATRRIVEDLARARPTLRLVDNPGRLQASAMNRAVEHAAGPDHRILVRCDAHSAYPPGFVLGVAESLASRGGASVAVPMDASGDGCFQRAVAFITDTPLGSGGSAHRGGTMSGWVDHGHHAGFDIGWYRKVGGYDETFAHNEDAEYDRRLVEAGGTIWLDADLRISIAPRSTIGGLAKQYWRYGRGRARTVLRHRMRPRLRQMIPVAHTLTLAAGAGIATAHWIGLVYPLAYLALCCLIGVWAAVRMKSACGLWAGAALLVMHTSWGAGFLRQVAVGQGAGPKLMNAGGA